jgi:hypothetical protein
MGGSLTVRVVETIADETDVEAMGEFVLADYVDPDAIESLANHESGVWRLSFELPAHTVVVTSDEVVSVTEKRPQAIGDDD